MERHFGLAVVRHRSILAPVTSTESIPCAFCAIISGESPADVVWENDEVLAFLDRRPLFPGHVLIVPKGHYPTITDLGDELLMAVVLTGRNICAVLADALGAEGSFVAANNVVSQSVPHFHLHVVPRRRGDGLRGFFWPRQRYASPAESAEVALTIRRALELASANRDD